MADLVVLGFSTTEIAEDVWKLGPTLEKDGFVDLEDSALVWREKDGRVCIQQAVPMTTKVGAATGAVGGAFWGLLLGLLLENPAIGLGVGTALGGAAGAASGALLDIGLDPDFICRIGEQLQPGTAAVFVLARRATPDRVIEVLKDFHPVVLHTNLSRDREDELVKALQAAM
jgi:uncharacterized membrane protein